MSVNNYVKIFRKNILGKPEQRFFFFDDKNYSQLLRAEQFARGAKDDEHVSVYRRPFYPEWEEVAQVGDSLDNYFEVRTGKAKPEQFWFRSYSQREALKAFHAASAQKGTLVAGWPISTVGPWSKDGKMLVPTVGQ